MLHVLQILSTKLTVSANNQSELCISQQLQKCYRLGEVQNQRLQVFQILSNLHFASTFSKLICLIAHHSTFPKVSSSIQKHPITPQHPSLPHNSLPSSTPFRSIVPYNHTATRLDHTSTATNIQRLSNTPRPFAPQASYPPDHHITHSYHQVTLSQY